MPDVCLKPGSVLEFSVPFQLFTELWSSHTFDVVVWEQKVQYCLYILIYGGGYFTSSYL